MNEAIQPALNRLFDSQHHWHNAFKNYFEPNIFRMSINSLIQELRNVTFVLQSNKREIEGFDAWYTPWQSRMRANKNMRWLVDSRNRIVKQGDLELRSLLKATVVKSYDDSNNPIFEEIYSPSSSPEKIISTMLAKGVSEEIIFNNYLKLERKWIDKDYPNDELLTLLRDCWVVVLDLLLDAPGMEGASNSESTVNLPPCMHKDSETHSIWLRVNREAIVPIALCMENIEINDEAKLREHYKDSPMLNGESNIETFKNTCETLFEQAKFVLAKDGYHNHLIIIFVNTKPVNIINLQNEDHADKQRTIRRVASEIEKLGGTEFIMVSEVWRAEFDPKYPTRRATDSPNKIEALTVLGASKSGEGYTFSADFRRENNKIIFDKTHIAGIEGNNFIKPILSIWGYKS